MQLIGRRQAHSELISLALEHCGRTQLVLVLSVARPVNGALYGGRVDRLPVCEVHRHLILIGNSLLVEYLLVCLMLLHRQQLLLFISGDLLLLLQPLLLLDELARHVGVRLLSEGRELGGQLKLCLAGRRHAQLCRHNLAVAWHIDRLPRYTGGDGPSRLI